MRHIGRFDTYRRKAAGLSIFMESGKLTQHHRTEASTISRSSASRSPPAKTKDTAIPTKTGWETNPKRLGEPVRNYSVT